MENTNTFKVQSTSSNLISLNVTPGHYATSSSHINYYIDMTSLKSRRSEAHAAAKVLAARYAATTIIDTIVCLDGTNVIGAYLADELLNTGILSANLHNTAYIISPEQHSGGQLIFRENYLSMIKGKHVLVLLATATTGKTLQTALECIEYYGGEVVGVSSIFSAADEIHGEQGICPDWMTFICIKPYDFPILASSVTLCRSNQVDSFQYVGLSLCVIPI